MDSVVEEIGWLQAPVFRDHNIKTIDEANKKADELLAFYKKYENALTTVEVIGIVPPLQWIVEYSPFIPVGDDDRNEMTADLEKPEKLCRPKRTRWQRTGPESQEDSHLFES